MTVDERGDVHRRESRCRGRQCLRIRDAAPAVVAIHDRQSLVREHVADVRDAECREDHERVAASVGPPVVAQFHAFGAGAERQLPS